jgi:hypothetical protein
VKGQLDLFQPGLADQFEKWKRTPGGAFVLNQAYRLAAGQAARFQRAGQPGSIALIWEQLRYRFDWIRLCAGRKGVSLDKWGGYRLNNNLRAYIARHVMERRPEWAGLFALRAVGQVRNKRRVVVITEPIRKAA